MEKISTARSFNYDVSSLIETVIPIVYPNTINVSDCGDNQINGAYAYLDIYNGKRRYDNSYFYIQYDGTSKWIFVEGSVNRYEVISSDDNPPKTGWTVVSGSTQVPVLSY